ncbi:MAG: hypothetical protein ACLFTA_01285 [Candidatus Nanohaloarchaea archaeon]
MILEASLLIGFVAVLLGTPVAEKYLAASGIYSRDQQKKGRPRIPTSGGLVVLMGFIFSLTFYMGASSITGLEIQENLLLAALSSTTIIALIGLIDDIHVDFRDIIQEQTDSDFDLEIKTGKTLLHQKALMFFGEDHEDEEVRGLSQFTKALMVLPAALPLIAVGAGSWVMKLPVIGTVNWGLIYPLILLPVGLIFVANAINILAGTNGLEAGLSLVAALTLGTFAHLNGMMEASTISFSLGSALAAFLIYNRYPASILPGDSLTYMSGAALFTAIVIGDMETFAVFLFMPWMLEFVLKARSGFNADSWGLLQEDGSLRPKHSKNYSLTHPLMRRGLTEKQVTYTLVLMVAAWAAAVTAVFTYTGL